MCVLDAFTVTRPMVYVYTYKLYPFESTKYSQSAVQHSHKNNIPLVYSRSPRTEDPDFQNSMHEVKIIRRPNCTLYTSSILNDLTTPKK
jgi:hypothetical protein